MIKKIGILVLFLLPFTNDAASFLFWEQSGRAIGNYAAEGATINDASTAWYNSAGLAELKYSQASVSAIHARSDSKYEGAVNVLPVVPDFTNNTGKVESKDSGFLSSAFFAMPINEKLTSGLHMTVPFVYDTDFSRDAFSRYSGTRNSFTVIDIGPSFGYQLSKALSLGAGLSWQKLKLANQEIVTSQTIENDSLSRIDLESQALGWDVGLLWEPTMLTKIGLAYRSQTIHKVSGKSSLNGPITLNNLYESTSKGKIVLPDSMTLSAEQKLNEHFSIMGTMQYTQWSKIQQINIANVAASNDNGSFKTINITFNEKFHNAWRLVLGGDYRVNSNLQFRAGAGYEQDPSRSNYRTLPNSGNKYVAAVGGSYQFNKNLSADFGFSHAVSEKASINSEDQFGDITTFLNGHSALSLNEIGLQLNWSWV